MLRLLTHLFLCGLRAEDTVELERFPGVRRQNLGVRRELKAALGATVVAAAAEHADVASQVLQLATQTRQLKSLVLVTAGIRVEVEHQTRTTHVSLVRLSAKSRLHRNLRQAN